MASMCTHPPPIKQCVCVSGGSSVGGGVVVGGGDGGGELGCRVLHGNLWFKSTIRVAMFS